MRLYKGTSAVRFGYLTASYFLTLILFSRFANLDTLSLAPLTLGYTMPALAYTSGKYSLPSAADARHLRPDAREIQFSRFGQSSRPDSLKVPAWRFTCQQSGLSALLIVWHGAQAAHPVMEPRPRPPAQIPWARPLCQAILKSCNVPH